MDICSTNFTTQHFFILIFMFRKYDILMPALVYLTLINTHASAINKISVSGIVENIDGNQLTLGIGTVTIVGTANLEAPKTPLVLGTGNVTVTADANVTASGNNLIIRSGSVTIVGTASIEAPATAMTLRTGEVGVITWNEIIPGATMVWTPIKPYG